MDSWKSWEGKTVDKIFPLHRYLGGEAVFVTEYQDRQAAIKIVAAECDPA